MEILEHQTQRPFSCERGDELIEPVEGLVLDRVGREVAHPLLLLRLERQAEQGGEERIRLLRLVGERAGELGPQLEADARLGVGDAEPEPASEHLAHRPVRDGLGVGDGVTGEEAHAPVEALLGLGDEARLADPRLAGDRDDRRPLPSSSPSSASLSAASSCSRPTSGASGAPKVARGRPATRNAATGSLFPFSSRSPSSSSSNKPGPGAPSSVPTTRSPSACRRAATLTVSPSAL